MAENEPAAIVARDLRKEYIIHTRQATSIKEMVIKQFFEPGERVPFVALQALSFTLPQGRSLAVVGANGSGKSTLLKLISGITDSSGGELRVEGRVAALLELGAGFQPEFTGMENIFLQCSILGLPRAEILKRLDAIIAFSELENFIHTPVKRYSSGMFVRLGFAIASHVDADVILLDEILAVGDQTFQLKCIRKIQELRAAGKTILFVSHSLDHIETIADLVLWLDRGHVVQFGTADDVLPKFYEALQHPDTSTGSAEVEMDKRALAALPAGRFAARKARLLPAKFLDREGNEKRSFHIEEEVILSVDFEVMDPLPGLELHFALGTLDSLRAAYWGSGPSLGALKPGRYNARLTISDHHLPPGRFLVSIMLADPQDIKSIFDIHLRIYAISLHKESGRIVHRAGEGKLMPWGRFSPSNPIQAPAES